MARMSVDMKFFSILIYASLLIFGMSAFPGKALAGQKQIGPVEEKILRDMHIDPHGSGVSIGQDRVIEVNEVIVDDVVVVGANLTVNGKVHGDVVCIGGSMKVGPQAEISGDMVNIGGQLNVDPAAKTNGERVNMGSSPFGSSQNSFLSGSQPFGNNWPGMNESDSEPTFTSKIIRLALDVIYLGFLLFFALILTVFMPKQFNHIEEHLSNDFPRCTLLGIALMIGFPLLLLAFVITLVGILVIPLIILAWVLSCLLGYIAFARILGRRIISEKPVMLQILVGLFLLSSPLLIGDVFLLIDGSFGSVIGHVFRVIGFIILIGVNFIGFGAVVYSLWGKRELLKFGKNKQNDSSDTPANGNGDAALLES